MTEYNIPHTENIPLHEDEEDDSAQAFIERIKALYGGQRTSLDELIELSKDPDATKRFEVLLDDITYEALFENAEFTENAKIMRTGKISADKQILLRDRQRELFETYKEAIIREAGLPTEVALGEVQKSKRAIKSLIEARIENHDDTQPLALLQDLGILKTDQEGVEHFTYPEDLFPKATDEKWLTYLESVRTHLRVERSVHAGTVDKTELGNADAARRMAHNAVARDVDDILGFDKLPDAKWDFEKTRNLLAKMRDNRFPTVETAEKYVTEKAVLEGVIGLHAVKALVTRLSDMHE